MRRLHSTRQPGCQNLNDMIVTIGFVETHQHCCLAPQAGAQAQQIVAGHDCKCVTGSAALDADVLPDVLIK